MVLKDLFSVTLILFSVIDILGNIPIIIGLKRQGYKIEAAKATLVSLAIMIAFLYLGESLLSLFGVRRTILCCGWCNYSLPFGT